MSKFHNLTGRWGEQYNNILENKLSIDEYLAMKLAGYTDNRIAMDLHVSIHTLNRWKSKKNVDKRSLHYRRYLLIEDLLTEGLTMRQIAIRLNLSVEQCYNIKRRMEIENFPPTL